MAVPKKKTSHARRDQRRPQTPRPRFRARRGRKRGPSVERRWAKERATEGRPRQRGDGRGSGGVLTRAPRLQRSGGGLAGTNRRGRRVFLGGEHGGDGGGGVAKD